MGPTGSGKSTLLNVLGCLDTATSGSYTLDGVLVDGLGAAAMAALRRQKVGFVCQGFDLSARTSAVENVELPLLYDRSGRRWDTRELAVAALERVGLGNRLGHQVHELTGGQQQRVAIARALVNEPALILADEPTATLDPRSKIEVMQVFRQLNAQGATVVIVAHEPDVAGHATRMVQVRDGAISRDEPVRRQDEAARDPQRLSTGVM
jgi:putative ABC transport system ATP-binding protein